MQNEVHVLEITCWCWSILNRTKGTSVFNSIDLDGDSPPIIKCPGCDFDIKVSPLRNFSEDPTYNSCTMVWPPVF